MRRDRINARLRGYVRDHLSPKGRERDLVTKVYASICDVIGKANALQIGSYPRFTAISPLHDLDVLYILGAWDPHQHDPAQALADLQKRLTENYVNPTSFALKIERQTHSVTVRFVGGGDDVFAVDVVPAFINGRNSQGEDVYVVPEIATQPHRTRSKLKEAVSRGEREMGWVRTDPRGYIRQATTLNQANGDFRKAVKLAKGWRHHRNAADERFPLKSFHLEQIITEWTAAHPNADIFDIIFAFFCHLPNFIRYPQIPDRADPNQMIDGYVSELSHQERRLIDRARDGFLIALENLEEGSDVARLVSVGPHERAGDLESYLFDQAIPMLDEHGFTIVGEVLPRDGGFRPYILDRLGLIKVDRKVRFRLGNNAPPADLYKWKVKNDDDSPQPRGEITDHGTKNDPEETKYNGHHFVECYAVRNGVCIGRGRQDVVLKR